MRDLRIAVVAVKSVLPHLSAANVGFDCKIGKFLKHLLYSGLIDCDWRSWVRQRYYTNGQSSVNVNVDPGWLSDCGQLKRNPRYLFRIVEPRCNSLTKAQAINAANQTVYWPGVGLPKRLCDVRNGHQASRRPRKTLLNQGLRNKLVPKEA